MIPGLWAVVNNAGIGFPGPIEWVTVEEMKKAVDVNLWGMVSVTKAFLPMLKRTKGRIVNVASTSGRVATPGAAAYCISKFGVEAFSDSLRNEVKHFGVTVHIIEPGNFKTNITSAGKNRQCLERLWENLDTDTRECYGKEYYEQGRITFLKHPPSPPPSTPPPQKKQIIMLEILHCQVGRGSSYISGGTCPPPPKKNTIS